MFLRFLYFFKKFNLFNVGLVVLYFLLVVLPHNFFGGRINEFFKPLGRDTYNLIIISIGALGLFAYFLLIAKGLKYGSSVSSHSYRSNKKKIFGYLLLTIFLVLIAINTLLVINIEIIHFVQYAILAILLFPIYWDYTATLFWAVMMAIWDESYQYWVLNPTYNYFDFNDIILDLLGATLGLLLIAAYDVVKEEKAYINNTYLERLSSYFKKQPTVFWGLLLFSSFLLTAYVVGWLRVFPLENEAEAPIQLIRNYNPAFWQTIPKGFTFHVIKPLEGLCILLLLFLTYTRLGPYPNLITTKE